MHACVHLERWNKIMLLKKKVKQIYVQNPHGIVEKYAIFIDDRDYEFFCDFIGMQSKYLSSSTLILMDKMRSTDS